MLWEADWVCISPFQQIKPILTMNWVHGIHRKKPYRNQSSRFRAIDSISIRLQDPRTDASLVARNFQ